MRARSAVALDMFGEHPLKCSDRLRCDVLWRDDRDAGPVLDDPAGKPLGACSLDRPAERPAVSLLDTTVACEKTLGPPAQVGIEVEDRFEGVCTRAGTAA